jgi:hypothetical protein
VEELKDFGPLVSMLTLMYLEKKFNFQTEVGSIKFIQVVLE